MLDLKEKDFVETLKEKAGEKAAKIKAQANTISEKKIITEENIIIEESKNHKTLRTVSTNEITEQSIESFLQTLNPKEKRIIREFMGTSAYYSFVDYLLAQTNRRTYTHNVNILGFKVKEDFSLRFHGRLQEFKKDGIIHVPKNDSYTTLFLKHSKLERIF